MPTVIIILLLNLITNLNAYGFNEKIQNVQWHNGVINETLKSINDIQADIKKHFEKLNAECFFKISEDKIFNCFELTTKIGHRLLILSEYSELLQQQSNSLPPELDSVRSQTSLLVVELKNQLSKTKINLDLINKKLESVNFEKINQRLKSLNQTAKLKGITFYMCNTARQLAPLIKFKSEQSVKEKNFALSYQYNIEVQRLLAQAKLATPSCPEKIKIDDFIKIKNILAPNITSKNAKKYLKDHCHLLKDNKESCLKSGFKKSELFFTLFYLNKELL